MDSLTDSVRTQRHADAHLGRTGGGNAVSVVGHLPRTQTSVVGELRVLGPIQVVVGGDVVDVSAPKLAALLAALASRAGVFTSVDQLAEVLWADDVRPLRVPAVVQTYVHRLRGLVGESAITTGPAGYRLTIAAGDWDLGRFRAAVAVARAEAARSRTAAAVAALVDGLALWRGEAFAGVDLPAGLSVAEERMAAREYLAELRIALGEPAAATADLLELTRSAPLREHAAELLIRALHDSGRRADALAEFDRARRALRDELGVDPTQRMRDLHKAILGDHVPRQLPALARYFTGRADELAALAEHLATPGQVIFSIEGTAGVGKTTTAVRLAQMAAERCPDGDVHLDLRGYGPGEPVDPGDGLSTLLRSIGVQDTTIPTDLGERAALWRTRTADKRLVVLLDNALDTTQVRPLLPGPACVTIITSRAGLTGLAVREGAHRLTLERLPSADAVELLTRVVGAAAVAAEPAVARELVERAARLPLTVRVLAERAKSAPSLAALLCALSAEQDQLSPFGGTDDIALDLRAVFSYSYNALSPAAAALFRLLALHPGTDFDASAAAALAHEPEVHAALRELVDAHMVERAGTARFRMHDLIRAYAHDLCVATDSNARRARAIGGLLDFYLSGAIRAGSTLMPHWAPYLSAGDPGTCPELADTARARDWCAAESDAIAGAVHLAHSVGAYRHAWRIFTAMHCYYYIYNRYRDGLALSNLALDATRRLGDLDGEAWVHNVTGFLLTSIDQNHALVEHLESLRLRRNLPDASLRGANMLTVAVAYNRVGRHHDALALCLQALADAESHDDQYARLSCLAHLGSIEIAIGRHREALDHLDTSLAILDPLPDAHHQGLRLTFLGLAYAGLGLLDDAAHHLRQAIATAESRDLHAKATRLMLLADVHHRSDDPSGVDDLRAGLALITDLTRLGEIRDVPPSTHFWNTMAMFGPSDEITHHTRVRLLARADNPAEPGGRDLGPPVQFARH